MTETDARAAGPYKGLAPFADTELDSLLFFGREREREIVVANLIAARLTVLYGPSGVGKSSLLRAGVARSLRGLPERPVVVVFSNWAGDLAEDLAAALSDAAGIPVAGSLREALAQIGDRDVYVILDQAEEYFVYHGAGHQAFEDAFVHAITQPLRVNVLLSLREDSLAKLDRFKGRIPNLFGNSLRLDRLDRASARAAIVRPLERWNELEGSAVEIEPELVETVLDGVGAGQIEVGAGGVGGETNGRPAGIEAPYLQLVMRRIWDVERAEASDHLRASTLDDLGGPAHIVAGLVEDAANELNDVQQVVAAELTRYIVTPSGTKIAHTIPDLAAYAGVDEEGVESVVRSMVERRILRPADGGRYEIYHDVLASEILAWRSRYLAARTLGRERAAAKRRHRRLAILFGAAMALVAVMVGVTLWAFAERRDARAQAILVRARQLDTTAVAGLRADPELSLLLSVEAARIAPSARVEESLRESLIASRIRGVLHSDGAVVAAGYTRDGTRVLVAGAGGIARLYDTTTRQVLRSFSHGGALRSAALSANGKLVVTGGQDGRARIWDASSGRLLRTVIHGAPVVDVRFDPGDRLFATAGGHAAKLWSLSRSGLIAALRTPKPVAHVTFSPDGRRIAVTGPDRRIRLFHLPDGKPAGVLDQGTAVTSVAFSPDGAFLVSGGRNKTGTIWHVRAHAREHVLRGHVGQVLAVAFNPNGRLIATGSSDGTARIWDARTGSAVGEFNGHTNPVYAVAFSPDGFSLVTGSGDGTAKVWNIKNGDQRALLAGSAGRVTQVTFSPDGRSVLTWGDADRAGIWDPRTQPEGRLVFEQKQPLVGAWFAGTSLILVAGPGANAELVRLDDGRVVRDLRASGPVTTAASNEDGSRVAVAAGTQTALFDVATGTRLRVLGQASAVTAVAFAADGRSVVTGSADGVARVWGSNGSLEEELPGKARLIAVAFCPDAAQVATASAKVATVWNVPTRHPLFVLKGHRDRVNSVDCSRDGRYVVTSSRDHDARVWDAVTGSLVSTLVWHFGEVRDAVFSSDGRWIVTAGPVTAQLWQPGVRQPLLPFGIGGHVKPLTSVAFDPTSRVVLTASLDGTVRAYTCTLCGSVDDLLRLAAARLAATGRTLTADERRRYLG